MQIQPIHNKMVNTQNGMSFKGKNVYKPPVSDFLINIIKSKQPVQSRLINEPHGEVMIWMLEAMRLSRMLEEKFMRKKMDLDRLIKTKGCIGV